MAKSASDGGRKIPLARHVATAFPERCSVAVFAFGYASFHRKSSHNYANISKLSVIFVAGGTPYLSDSGEKDASIQSGSPRIWSTFEKSQADSRRYVGWSNLDYTCVILKFLS